MPLPIKYGIESNIEFRNLLSENPGIIVIKFGAEWCNPCKRIEEPLKHYISQLSDQVLPVIVDVDESFEVYAYLKNKRMINGIPVILAYYKGNINYAPDDIHIGTDLNQLRDFFERIHKKSKAIV
jgi:thioredoxin-like negative regulator of GroEL